MSLKGIIDANKVPISHKYFWNNYLNARVLGLAGGLLFRHKLSPKLKDLPVYDRSLMSDPYYAMGYDARVLTRAEKKAYNGFIWGMFVPCLLI